MFGTRRAQEVAQRLLGRSEGFVRASRQYSEYRAWWRRLLRAANDSYRRSRHGHGIVWYLLPHEEFVCGRSGARAYWTPGDWTRWQWRSRLRQRMYPILHGKGSSMGSSWYSGPGRIPRTCSYDGGVHPEDAILMVQGGWTVEGTDKSYKRYLEPPGYREWCERQRPFGYSAPGRPLFEPPVPSMKVYVQHFSDDQIQRFNAAIRKPK